MTPARPFHELLYPASVGENLVPGTFLADEGPVRIQNDLVIARDGSKLLQQFFNRVPTPRTADEAIRIPWRFRSLVPEGWRRATRFYRYTRAPGRSTPRLTLLCGMLFPGDFSLSSLARRFRSLRKVLDPRSTRLTLVFGSLENRPTPNGMETKSLNLFYEIFGEEIEPLSLDELKSKRDLSDFAFFDLTSPKVCADSYFSQHLLARGAAPLLAACQGLSTRQPAPESSWLALSPYHGIELLGGAGDVSLEWKRASAQLRALEYATALQRGLTPLLPSS